MHEPLAIGRFIDPETQQDIASKALERTGIDRDGIPFRKLLRGNALLKLVSERRYEKALSQPRGKLRHLSTDETEELIKENVRQHPTGSGRLTVETRKLYPHRWGSLIVMTYPIQAPELDDEYDDLTQFLDELNGVRGNWGQRGEWAALTALPIDDSRVELVEQALEALRPASLDLTLVQATPPIPLIER